MRQQLYVPFFYRGKVGGLDFDNVNSFLTENKIESLKGYLMVCTSGIRDIS